MEQVNNSATLDLLQAIAVQSQTPKAGGKANGDSDFQKLMDKAAAGGRDAKAEDASKAEKPAEDKTGEAGARKEDSDQKEENPLEQVKKLAEQGYAILQPIVAMTTLDGQVYEPGEYVIAWKGTSVEFVPVAALDEPQMAQLQQLVAGPVNVADVADPEADAMLEATDPTVDHSPAALLEKVVAEQTGKVSDSAVETVQSGTAEQDDEPLMEVTAAAQAPQPLFRDVEAAPVKVGEVYDAPEAEEINVAQQVDAGIAQALEKGESMVRIQLNPENLGSVTVEITKNAEGVIHVALTAHSGETRGLLERHAGELQGMLSSRTQQNVEVNVQRQQESQQNQNRNYDGHNGHAQDGEHRQRRQQEQTDSQDFIQQLRLGLIPVDGDE